MTDKEDCCVSGNCCGGSDVDSQSEHLTCNDKSDDQTSDCGGEDCCSPNADTGKRTGLDEAQDAMSDICCDAEGICGSANTTHVGGGVNANPVQRCGEVVIAKQINVEVREAPCAKACCPTTNNNGSTLASETQGSDKCSTGPPAKPSDGCCSSSGPVGAIATTGCQELAKATGAENQDCCGNRSTTSPLEVDEQDSQCEEGCCDDDSDESAIVEPLGTTKVAEEKGCCATETKGAGGCCGLKKPKAKPVKVMKADNSCACCMKTLLNQSATCELRYGHREPQLILDILSSSDADIEGQRAPVRAQTMLLGLPRGVLSAISNGSAGDCFHLLRYRLLRRNLPSRVRIRLLSSRQSLSDRS